MHPTRAYVLYNLLAGFANSTTVGAYTPTLFSIGLSLPQITLVNAVFWLTIVIMEIPTGLLADGKSRRFSVSCGVAANVLGYALYANAHGFWGAILAEVVAGIGSAFISGALSAWLTDSLIQRGEGEKLRHSLATGAFVSGSAMVAGGFTTAMFVAPHDLRACWLLGAVLYAALFAVTRLAMKEEGNPVHRVPEAEAWRQSVRALKTTRGLIWGTMAAIAMGLIMPFNQYWVPLIQMKANAEAVAWSWAPMYGAAAIAGLAVRRSKAPAGRENGLIALSVALTGIGLAFLWPNTGYWPILGLIVLHEFGRGLFTPLLDAYTQRQIEEHYRATYGSLQSFIGKIGAAGVLFLTSFGTIGRSPTVNALTTVLVVTGIGLVLSATCLWLFRPKAAAP
jgi:MFS family permease